VSRGGRTIAQSRSLAATAVSISRGSRTTLKKFKRLSRAATNPASGKSNRLETTSSQSGRAAPMAGRALRAIREQGRVTQRPRAESRENGVVPRQRKHESLGLTWVAGHDAEPVVAVGDLLGRPHEGGDLVAAFQRLADHFTARAARSAEDESVHESRPLRQRKGTCT
jgi:hypothetical protein